MKADHNPTWSALILAAGSSSRMGQPKQLLKIKGESLIEKIISTASEAEAEEIVVVLGFNQELIKNNLASKNVSVVINPDPQKGMGSSIKAGVDFISKNFPKLDALVILVCDQPLLKANHLKAIVNEFKKTDLPIIASGYSGSSGVPALFHKSIFEKLLSLSDNQGAKKLMKENSALVKTIDFPEGVVDLDTPEDLEKFRSLN